MALTLATNGRAVSPETFSAPQKSYIERMLESPLARQVEATFEKFLDTTKDDESCIKFLYSYVKFNRVFGGCVLSLARDIHVGDFPFVRDHSVPGCRDVNTNVASRVLYAAEDEFSNRETGERQTHRTAAQHFLASAMDYFEKKGVTIETDTAECRFAPLIKEGYGLPAIQDERQLFRSLGFHLATEFAGAQEFIAVDNWLKRDRPDMVAHMRGLRDEENTPGYWWLEEHTGVEVEHFKSAVQALEDAVACYQGQIPLDEVYALITAGHAQFYGAFSTYLGAVRKELKSAGSASIHGVAEARIEGGCLCGEVRYEISSSLKHASNCHCSMCRKASGAADVSYATVTPGSFKWVKGRERLARYDSSPGVSRLFCGNCGSSLGIEEGGQLVLVTLGTVDGDPGIEPAEHLYVGSAAHWQRITDDLPQHDELPATSMVA